jgi:hypothetical protein
MDGILLLGATAHRETKSHPEGTSAMVSLYVVFLPGFTSRCSRASV